MKRSATILFLATFILSVLPLHSNAQSLHQVFLEKTDHELHVYRIYGSLPGKTMIIIGGIQGDEPSGYITADLYADVRLRRGNLIVVPRANFYSILSESRNGANGDLNRKFNELSTPGGWPDTEIVATLKKLILESDVLLNLHEGSGFYNPLWLSDHENPDRFGQSIIYDTEVYQVADSHIEIALGALARKIVQKVNQQIGNPRHQFRSNNHDTLSDATVHPEQRKSASYFALTQAHIPAFGIEISKMIPDLDNRINLHKLVVNTMMEEFGLELDTPGHDLDEPALNYLLVRVNDNHPFALQSKTNLLVRSGDMISVTDIIANYDRGLIADIAGFGSTNDLGKTMMVTAPTRIVVRKDALVCGWVDLTVEQKAEVQSFEKRDVAPNKKTLSVADLKVESVDLTVNGKSLVIADGTTLEVPSNGTLKLDKVTTNIAMLDNEVRANFKGYVPPKSVNDGNDLHFSISMASDLWSKYSENGHGIRYPIIISYLGFPVGEVWVELVDELPLAR